MTKKLAKKIRPLFLIIGVLLLVLLIRKIGVQSILDNIGSLGIRLIPIFAISLLWFLLYTFAWMQFLSRVGDGIPFWRLFRIKAAGEAVNTLTPANFLGGDPLRIHLLKKNFQTLEGAASVVVDRTLHSTATLLVVLFGIIASFVTFNRLPSNIKFGVPIVMIIAMLFMIFILVHQHKGFFSLLMSLCKRLGIKKSFSEKTIERFEELDSHIIDFYKENRRGFLIAMLCHILGRLLGILEVYAIGRCVSDQFTLFAALVLCAMTPMINAVFTFIPGAFGVMEGAYIGILYLLHINPAIGITIQISKRLRSALWIILGLIFLGTHDRERVWKEELIEEV
jgi:uncharacterized protein (TIRG00374 family)